MKTNREQWGTRIGFILASVGSAIGLGNIWRFPYVAYENGGGAFLIPYFIALFTAGIPLLILEFGIGHRFKGAAPATFSAIRPKMAWLGWWQILISFVIATYYVVIIGWSISYFFFGFQQSWGTDTTSFFFKEFLKLSESPFHLGGMQWKIALAVIGCWLICWGVLFGGVKRGIELANKVFMPLLFVMVLVIMGRALTLPGAIGGVEWMFRPDFTALGDVKVWVAAFGQIFYSLSIGFAIMITYSSYLPDDADVGNNAFMTAFINCGFSMVAGIMIFAVLGYMAAQKGVGIQEVVSSGVGLAFITIPQAINFLPAPGVFGPIFFLSLIFAGLSSHISICEACVSALIEGRDLNRKVSVSVFCLVGGGVSLIFATGAGLYILDIVDHFINSYGILMAALVEIVFLAWVFRLEALQKHINAVSDFVIGNWWSVCLKFITPAILGYIGISKIKEDITTPYGDYAIQALCTYGWGVVILIVVFAFLIGLMGTKNSEAASEEA